MANIINKVLIGNTTYDIKLEDITIDNIDELPAPSINYLNKIYKVNEHYYHVALVYDKQDLHYSLSNIVSTGTSKVTANTYYTKIGSKIPNNFDNDWGVYDDESLINIYGGSGNIKFGTASAAGTLEWHSKNNYPLRYITELSFNVSTYSTSYEGYFSVNIYDASTQYVYKTFELDTGETRNFKLKNLHIPYTTDLMFILSSAALNSNAVRPYINLNSFDMTIYNGEGKVYKWVDISSQVSAKDIEFNNEQVSMQSTNIQNAIEESWEKSLECEVDGSTLRLRLRNENQ